MAKAIIYLLGRRGRPGGSRAPSPTFPALPAAAQGAAEGAGGSSGGGEGQGQGQSQGLGQAGPGTVSDDPVLTHLEGAVALVEQYYHPSNGGR